MFFPRLRRRAKWVFLLLAVLFAGGFVFFGVGAGGSGIGDYFADLFNRQPGATGGTSAEEARERIRKNPKDAEAHLALANAFQSEGETDAAITALRSYIELRPKDTDALQQLASLYETEAAEAQEEAAAAQAEAQATIFAQELQGSGSRLQQALLQDPISTTLQQETTERSTAAVTAAQEAYRHEAAIFHTLPRLLPADPNVCYEFGRTSKSAGGTSTAVKAYETFLKLAPDDPNAPLIREQLRLLKAQGGTG